MRDGEVEVPVAIEVAEGNAAVVPPRAVRVHGHRTIETGRVAPDDHDVAGGGAAGHDVGPAIAGQVTGDGLLRAGAAQRHGCGEGARGAPLEEEHAGTGPVQAARGEIREAVPVEVRSADPQEVVASRIA